MKLQLQPFGMIWSVSRFLSSPREIDLRTWLFLIAITFAESLSHSRIIMATTGPMPPLSDIVSDIKNKYEHYEDVFFKTAKGELLKAKEHPAEVAGVAVTAAFILMRAPRRFLIRNTLGRLQSEETKFIKAEKNVNELKLSIDLTKRESKKLLERSALAEKEMQQGRSELMNARNHLHRLTKSFQKAEAEASALMEELRELPVREALKLRAEVASTASLLRQEKNSLNKRMAKLSDMGIPV